MKHIIILFVFICSISLYGQDSVKINTHYNEVSKKVNTMQLNQEQNTIYQLKKDIINVQKSNLNLKKEVEEKHNDWLERWAKFWIIPGVLVGFLAVFFGYKEIVKKAVEKQVANEVKKKVCLLKEQLDEIEKHKKYKTKSKILIINKTGTAFPSNFKTVLKLFNTDVENKDNLIESNSIKEIVDNTNFIKKLKKADLVIIENKESCSKDGWCIDTNKNDFSDLANKIGDVTPIMYYGNKNFPITKVDEEKRHYVAFTKAASQLYGNILNLLKYKFELDNV